MVMNNELIKKLEELVLKSSDPHWILNFHEQTILLHNTAVESDFPELTCAKELYDLLEKCGFSRNEPSELMLKWEEHFLHFQPKNGQLALLHITSKSNSDSLESSLFKHNIAGVYQSNLHGVVISCNDAFAEILAYSKEELLGSDGFKLYVNNSDRHTFLSELHAKKRLKNYENAYLRKDGSIAYCIENAFLIGEGDQALITGTIQDISDQQLINQKFQRLFHAASDVVFILEEDTIIEANKRSNEVFAYKEKELVGRKVWDRVDGLFLFSDNDFDLLEHKLKHLEKESDRKRIKLLARRSDASVFHSEVFMVSFTVGKRSFIQVIVRDISERVLYENSIRESEERFRLMSQAAIEGMLILENNYIIDCNDQWVKMMDYRRPEELLGKNIRDFLSEGDVRRIESTFDHKSINKTEIRVQTKEGKTLVLEATGSEILYLGSPRSVVLFYDITKRKRTEQALEQSIDRYKNLVENSPNGIFILTDSKIKYLNLSALNLLEVKDEDEVYDKPFSSFFTKTQVALIDYVLKETREGQDIEYQEYVMENKLGEEVQVGIKAILTVYDNQPSIQVTVNNLSTRMMLLQEQMRAEIAEEINVVLKREIEDHKSTQLQLLQARNFTRNIIESSIDMIIAFDENEAITEFNSAAQQQFKYTLNKVQGMSIRMLYANEKDYDRVMSMLKEKQFFTGEIENIDAEGNVFTSLLSASVIRNQKGEIEGSMGVSRDITDFKLAEQELKDSEARYRDLFENATDFILNINDDGLLLYANNAFKRTLGIDENEEGINFFDLIKGGKREFKYGILKGLSDGTHEMVLVAKSGEEIIIQGNCSIRYKNGQADSVRGIFRDITSARVHEKKAREQTAKMISIFNSTENLMMWTIDKKGRITSFNTNFHACMRDDFSIEIQRKSNYLKQIVNSLNPAQHQSQLDSFKLAFKGRPQQFELPLLTESAKEVWHQIFLNPIYVDDDLDEISCLAYDISDRKEIDQKIRSSLREKEVLLQEVHHRVKNNLQVISSILNLQSSFVEDEKTLEILAESQNRIKTMSYIHETLYQTSDFSSIGFSEYIETLARNLHQSYSPRDSKIELDLQTEEIVLDLDQAIPCGLIMNELVSNALKYAFKGRTEGVLSIRVSRNKEKVELEVKDNGIGLPEGFKPEDSDSLGLYLVYALLEQLDAEITLSNSKGTGFLITFDF